MTEGAFLMAAVMRQCLHCETWFPSKTSRAIYCPAPASCRTLAARAKKRQLVELAISEANFFNVPDIL